MNKGKFRVRCFDCGALRMVARRELDRAARVRCLRCGGPTEMSHMGSERQATAEDARKSQLESLHAKQGFPRRKPG